MRKNLRLGPEKARLGGRQRHCAGMTDRVEREAERFYTQSRSDQDLRWDGLDLSAAAHDGTVEGERQALIDEATSQKARVSIRKAGNVLEWGDLGVSSPDVRGSYESMYDCAAELWYVVNDFLGSAGRQIGHVLPYSGPNARSLAELKNYSFARLESYLRAYKLAAEKKLAAYGITMKQRSKGDAKVHDTCKAWSTDPEDKCCLRVRPPAAALEPRLRRAASHGDDRGQVCCNRTLLSYKI